MTADWGLSNNQQHGGRIYTSPLSAVASLCASLPRYFLCVSYPQPSAPQRSSSLASGGGRSGNSINAPQDRVKLPPLPAPLSPAAQLTTDTTRECSNIFSRSHQIFSPVHLSNIVPGVEVSHCSGARLRSNFRWPQDYFEWKQLIFSFRGECRVLSQL